MQITETNEPALVMDAAEWSDLMRDLIDPATERLSTAKIESLSPATKARAIRYQIGRKRAIIASFVSDALKIELQAAGYSNGYYNEFYDYWIRPEHQTGFKHKESKPTDPSGETEIKNSFVAEFTAYANAVVEKNNHAAQVTTETPVPPKQSGFEEWPEVNNSQPVVTKVILVEKPGKLGNQEFYTFYRELLSKAEVRLSDTIEEPVTCLEIIDYEQAITLATLGNFSLIVGKAKSRKTFLLSALVAALVMEGTIIQKIRGVLPAGRKDILYFDTEQHKGHVKRVQKRIAILAGRDDLPMVRFFQLKKYPPDQRLSAIRVAIEDTPNLGFIVIDGVRDTVFDINDAREATDRATDLLCWTEETDAHLITVIHENKGNNNARGHLGSELVNKAETVISVSRDPTDKSTSIVTPEYCRDREFEPFAFAIDEQGLPYLLNAAPVNNTRAGRPSKSTSGSMKSEDVETIIRRAFLHDDQ